MVKDRHNKNSILALILAGGKGERLYPLTLERTKPSVPFGGKYRIIDFALSNLVNSGIYSIYVLVQYKSQSLIEHIRTSWRKEGMSPHHFITVVPPQMRRENIKEWYRGTADSVYQNINLIYDFSPAYVGIFAGDHIYRMDIKQMLQFHIHKKAHLTVAVIPVDSNEAKKFGIVEVDTKSSRIKRFFEKPSLLSGRTVLASMGNYIFDTDVLIWALDSITEKTRTYDFGKDIIPYLVKRTRVYAYSFKENLIPGLKPYEDRYYWQDVGEIKSFWRANMDILGEKPKLDLDNPSWPIYSSSFHIPPAYIENSEVKNSLINEGAKVTEAEVINSIIGRGVKIEEGCHIRDSIIMDFTYIKRKSKIICAIIDRYNTILEKTMITPADCKEDEEYFVDPEGIVVLKRGVRGFKNNLNGF